MEMAMSVFCLHIAVLISIFCVNPAFQACTEPIPNEVLEVLETSPKGYLLFTLGESPGTTSWVLTVENLPILESYFSLQTNTSNGATVWEVLIEKPLDLESMFTITNTLPTSITLKMECTDQVTFNQVPYTRVIIIKAVSEYTPYFTSPNPSFSISEDASIGDSLFNLRAITADDDVRNFGDDSDIEQFTLNTYTGPGTSGNGMVDVSPTGIVRLLREVDYEKGDVSFFLNVTVKDYEGLSAEAIIQVNVNNTNDSPPFFIYSGCFSNCEEAEYRATVDPGITGPITSIAPGPIKAQDPDSDEISYKIISGSPSNFSDYLTMDSTTGQLTLKRSLQDFNFSHFALVVEASDACSWNMSGTVKSFHSVATSVLVLVPGRPIQFPAVPNPTRSAGTSSTEDALFISVIILSILLFLVITVAIVLACLLFRTRKLVFEHDRSKSQRTVTPKHYEVKMRSVKRGSEKEFMRSLSSGAQINSAFENSHGEDDVFVTDIATYYDLQGVLPRAENHGTNQPPQLIPFHEALAMKEEIPLNSAISTLASQDQNGGREDVNSVFIYDGKDTRLSHIDANTLESKYQALDLLTSVTPLKITGDSSVVESNSNTGTVRSLRDIDVISELEEIVVSQRVKPPRKNSLHSQSANGQKRDLDDLDGITSFTRDVDNSKNEIVPFEDKLKAISFENRKRTAGTGQKDLLTFSQGSSYGNPFKSGHSQQGSRSTAANPFKISANSNSERDTMMTPGLSGVYPTNERKDIRNSMHATKPNPINEIAFSNVAADVEGKESPYL